MTSATAEVADPDSAAHHAADRHKRSVIDYLAELLTAAGRSDAPELAAEFALLVDGAIVTAVRDATQRPPTAPEPLPNVYSRRAETVGR
ncbi:hypothetical protein ACQPXH_01400 [Nocardia sp. CA-135953]|uniref:hypothetical protein n=1 Tax=Nocardia sp. CA-135953 TaxID=3239978 RepID=UPI003D9529B6